MSAPADRPAPAMGLLPCPFCGGAAETRLASTCIAVVCIECDAAMEAQKPPTPRYVEPLCARWNRRAASHDAERLRSAQDAVWNEAILRAAAIVDDTSVLSCRNPYAGDDGQATLKEARNDILALLRPLTPPRDPQ